MLTFLSFLTIFQYSYEGKKSYWKAKLKFLKPWGSQRVVQILDLLKEGERCVCEIFPVIQQEQANVSKHLSILKQAGIVDCRKEGLRIIYWIKNPEVLNLLKEVTGILKIRIQEQQSLIANLLKKFVPFITNQEYSYRKSLKGFIP